MFAKDAIVALVKELVDCFFGLDVSRIDRFYVEGQVMSLVRRFHFDLAR